MTAPYTGGSAPRSTSGPILDRPRWERFAQLVAIECKTATQAYLAIGGTSKQPKQSGLLLQKNPRVKARIAELLDEQKRKLQDEADERERRRRQEYGRDTILDEMWKNYEAAGAIPQFGRDDQRRYAKGELDAEGEPVAITKTDFRARIRILEQLGFELGMFPRQSAIRRGDTNEMDGLTLDEAISFVSMQLMEASGGRLSIDKQLLLAIASGAKRESDLARVVRDPLAPDLPVLAAPEADGLRAGGQPLQPAGDPGGQPGREDGDRVRGDDLSPDR
jgi:hypothetical protein